MILTVNKKKYHLSNWINDMGHHLNWIRLDQFTPNFIGLNCNLNDNIQYLLYTNKAVRSELKWEIFGSDIFESYIDKYNCIYNHPKYNHLQLEDAKDNIDNFLNSYEKMKVYL